MRSDSASAARLVESDAVWASASASLVRASDAAISPSAITGSPTTSATTKTTQNGRATIDSKARSTLAGYSARQASKSAVTMNALSSGGRSEPGLRGLRVRAAGVHDLERDVA